MLNIMDVPNIILIFKIICENIKSEVKLHSIRALKKTKKTSHFCEVFQLLLPLLEKVTNLML